MRKNRTQRLRNKLWHDSPRCRYCDTETILPDGNVNNIERWATIEHLRSRLNPDRGKPTERPQTELCCWKCNQARNDDEQMRVGIEALRDKSGSRPIDEKTKKSIMVLNGHIADMQAFLKERGLRRQYFRWLNERNSW